MRIHSSPETSPISPLKVAAPAPPSRGRGWNLRGRNAIRAGARSAVAQRNGLGSPASLPSPESTRPSSKLNGQVQLPNEIRDDSQEMDIGKFESPGVVHWEENNGVNVEEPDTPPSPVTFDMKESMEGEKEHTTSSLTSVAEMQPMLEQLAVEDVKDRINLAPPINGFIDEDDDALLDEDAEGEEDPDVCIGSY